MCGEWPSAYFVVWKGCASRSPRPSAVSAVSRPKFSKRVVKRCLESGRKGGHQSPWAVSVRFHVQNSLNEKIGVLPYFEISGCVKSISVGMWMFGGVFLASCGLVSRPKFS